MKHAREFRPFRSAPKDGTPFILPTIARINPDAEGRIESLTVDVKTGELVWVEMVRKAGNPRWWCEMLPRRKPVPEGLAFVGQYRLAERRPVAGWVAVTNVLASGIEAPSGGETRSGSTEGESPTAESGDAHD